MRELLALRRRRDARALGRPRARLHRDARLAAPARGDRRALRDARGRRRDRRRRRERGALPAVLGARAPGRSRRRAVARLPVALRPRARAGRRGGARRAAARGRLGARPRPHRRRHAADDARRGRQPPAQPDRHAPERGASSTRSSELVERHGATLVCDEVYRGLEQDPAARLPAAADRSPRAVSVGVLSKSYALAGLRVGWLATRDRELLDAVAQVRDYTSLCSPAPSEVLGVIALRAADALVERSRAIIAANLPLVDALLAEHPERLDWVRPSAGSIGFPRYRGGEGIDAFNERLVREQGVLLLPGRVYGYGDGRFRLGFGRTQPARGGRAARPAAARVSVYDRIGGDLRGTRRPDPRIERQIAEALGDARSVVNVGAGVGSYEPRDRDVVAVEPSAVMLAQRPPGRRARDPGHRPRSCRSRTASFDAALAVLTMHHWSRLARGRRRAAARRAPAHRDAHVRPGVHPPLLARARLPARDRGHGRGALPAARDGRRGARRRRGAAGADRGRLHRRLPVRRVEAPARVSRRDRPREHLELRVLLARDRAPGAGAARARRRRRHLGRAQRRAARARRGRLRLPPARRDSIEG